MDADPGAGRPGPPLKFIRIVAGIAAALIVVVTVTVYTAPHVGRITDAVLNLAWHREWTRLTLPAGEAFHDLSTPAQSIRSYYSALYRGDATHLAQLAVGPFHEQLRLRLQHAEPPPDADPIVYRSYLLTVLQGGGRAVVTEKFHLFWRHGLRFHLQRTAHGWSISELAMVR